MANNDLIIVLAAGGGVALAYAANVGGFRDWLNGLFKGGGGIGSFLPAYGPSSISQYPANYFQPSTSPYKGISTTSANQLKAGGLNASGRPNSAGSSGNCSWDTKGGFCWASSACGKPFKTCSTMPAFYTVSAACDGARSNFIVKAPTSANCKGAKFAQSYNTDAYPDQSITVS